MAHVNFKVEIPKIIKRDGYWGIMICDLSNNKVLYDLNANQQFYAASVNKLPIAVTLLQEVENGEISLGQPIIMEDKYKREGSGILTDLKEGISLRVDDLLRLMLILSDNTATKLLVNLLGVEKINSVITGFGFTQTQLKALPDNKFYFGNTTPSETANLLARLYKEQILAKEQLTYLFDIMTCCQFNLGVTRYKLQLEKNNQLLIVHKQGTYEDNRHEAGIILGKQPILFSIFSAKLKDRGYYPDNTGNLILAEIGRLLYRYLGFTK